MTHREQRLALARDRERLIAECARQRADLAADAEHLRGVLSIGDRVMAGVRYVRERPLLFAAAGAALFMLRSRGIWQLARRGFTLWRLWRSFRTVGAGTAHGARPGMFERFFASR